METTANNAEAAPAVTAKRRKTKPVFHTSLRERLSYNSFWVGQNVLFIIVSTFLAVYYTTALGIPAAVVGTILLFARLYDALIDPVLATVIERFKLKSGKFKPWVFLAAITVPLFTVLCFGFEGVLTQQDLAVRIAYATVTYLLWGTVYAASDGPGYALGSVMSPEPAERNVILSNNHVAGIIGILLGIAVMPQVLAATANNWFLSIVIFAVVGFLAMLPIRTAKERVSDEGRERPSILQIWRAVVQNKYLMLTVIIGLIVNGVNFALTLAPFVATDIYGSASSASLLLMLGILPVIVVAPFGARLIRRFGKIPLLAFSLIAGAVLSVVAFLFCRDSFTLMLVVSALKGVVLAPQVFMFSLLFADSIEYDFYKNKRRYEAATFAMQTMMTKAGTAISGAIGLWVIGLAGYQSSVAGQTVTQTAGAIDAMWAVYNLGAAIGSAIGAFILLKFYDLTEAKLAVMVEDNKKHEQIVD
ncbi:MFS transporter [Microbacterium sp. B2969]|uniref:MFS transporter n=1 Tax=Microbacterium alkaliflavum TaxID=3248839 RepID=A0ABW7Q409_9MICO